MPSQQRQANLKLLQANCRVGNTPPYFSSLLLLVMVIKMKYQIFLQYIVLNMFLLVQLELPASSFDLQTQNNQISTFTTSNRF
ncbi:MAG: hypothetical protein ACRC8K_19500 [Waterburya sp.]